jgi:hypothetical protein
MPKYIVPNATEWNTSNVRDQRAVRASPPDEVGGAAGVADFPADRLTIHREMTNAHQNTVWTP